MRKKHCPSCRQEFERPPAVSERQWADRKYCSKRCAATKRSMPDSEIVDLYRSGASSVGIATIAGVTDVQVRRILHVHNAMRDASAAQQLSQARPEVREKVSRARKGIPCSERTKASLREHTGPANRLWRSGITVSGGYIAFTNSPANGVHAGRYLHRVIAEHCAGRRLRSDEHVHHVDGDKFNNHPDNLEVLPASDHARLHAEQSQFWRRSA